MLASGFFPSGGGCVEEERYEHHVDGVQSIQEIVKDKKLDNLCMEYTSLNVVTPYIVGERGYDHWRGFLIEEKHLFFIKNQTNPAVYANCMARLEGLGCKMSFFWRWKGLHRLKKMMKIHSQRVSPQSVKNAVLNYKNGLKL